MKIENTLKITNNQLSVTRLIPLTQGKFAIVDAEDYDWLSQYKWYAARSGTTFYACRARGRTTVHMHREIMRAPRGVLCDHRNHNGLDNRLSNLRLCTSSQNARNQQARAGCTSKFKGVCWHKKDRKWQARITCNGNRMHLGSLDNEIDGAVTYDDKAIELFGEFAYLNFPERIELRNWIRKIIYGQHEPIDNFIVINDNSATLLNPLSRPRLQDNREKFSFFLFLLAYRLIEITYNMYRLLIALTRRTPVALQEHSVSVASRRRNGEVYHGKKTP